MPILHLPELRMFASQLLIEPPLIPTTKQNKLNTDKKLDFSTGRVFVQCEKSQNTQLSNFNKIHFEELSLVDAKLSNLRLLGPVNNYWLSLTARAYGRCIIFERIFMIEYFILELGCSNIEKSVKMRSKRQAYTHVVRST